MVSVKTDYNLHEKYNIKNELKEIQNTVYDGEFKKQLIPKESVDEVLNMFEKFNINVIQYPTECYLIFTLIFDSRSIL